MLIDNNLINWLKLTWLAAIKDIFFNIAWSDCFQTVGPIVSDFTLRSSTSSPFLFSNFFVCFNAFSWPSVLMLLTIVLRYYCMFQL